MPDMVPSDPKTTDFEAEARKARSSGGPVGEFWYYLRTSRRWIMAPIILSLLAAGVLIVLGGTAAAPFIYALF
jgi:hypothetical protein